MTTGPQTEPIAWLLVGLTGAGKTTLALKLAERGAVRLSVDETVAARHGRYGVDYPHQQYKELEEPVVAELTERLAGLIRSGTSVVFDHGLWERETRDRYKKVVEHAGGRWRLVYLDVPKDELLARLAARNERTDANALTVSPGALDDFFDRFEPPVDDEGAEPAPEL